jgi:hypothetical protein
MPVKSMPKGTPAVNSADVIPSLRDLIAHLTRGNAKEAETILREVDGYFKGIVVLAKGAANGDVEKAQRAQQAIFAIDEVRLLLAERDFAGAASSARDAVKEWKDPVPGIAKK